MSSLASSPSRKFAVEFTSMVERTVRVRTAGGKEYVGKLLGFDTNSLSVVLGDAVVGGKKFPRLVIYGNVIEEIALTEEPLDLEAFAKKLEEVFPRLVKYYPEARVITVMERIRVTERGVEGTGPVAERVRALFEDYVRKVREGSST